MILTGTVSGPKSRKSVMLDGTFADYKKAKSNIQRSLDHARYVSIFYVYQDPILAWEFTKAREALEGRKVPKNIFVDSLFKAKENVGKYVTINYSQEALHERLYQFHF